MGRSRLLDLFCGAGGCSVGYHRAGFDVVGVDMDMPALRRYPFPAVRMDAMAALGGGIDLDAFDAIHASPPCQAYSVTRHTHSVQHPDLLPPVLATLTAWGARTGRPWVIENVPGAPMPPELTITMCGAQHRAHDPRSGLTLRLRRHRLFASNVFLWGDPCSCDRTPVGGVYAGGNTDREHALKVRRGGYNPPSQTMRALMGIDWMTYDQITQAIPPAYTEHIGAQLIDALRADTTNRGGE